MRKNMLITRRNKAKSLIPVSAMADIAFLLLIFFMLSSILEMEREIPVNLPEARVSKTQTGTYFNIWVTADGDYIFDDKKGTLEGLAVYARYRFTGNSDMRALINADREIPYHYINGVLDALKQAGVNSI